MLRHSIARVSGSGRWTSRKLGVALSSKAIEVPKEKKQLINKNSIFTFRALNHIASFVELATTTTTACSDDGSEEQQLL